MEITGHFKNINDDTIEVKIWGKPEIQNSVNIDTNDNIFFGKDPINIEYSMDDLFLPIISKSCTITLLTKDYLGELLYANNEHDIVVNVSLVNDAGKKMLFAGFVEPNIYSQEYSTEFNQLDIVCTDFLATLQYNNIFKTNNGKSKLITFNDIFNAIGLNTSILSDNGTPSKVYWANNMGFQYTDTLLTKNNLGEIGFSINLFYDEVPEESLTNDEVLSECLKYLNLHIILEGKDFILFNTVDGLKTLNDSLIGYDVTDNTKANLFKTKQEYNITKNDFASTNTNISLDETYNQIQLTDEITKFDTLVESPMDDDNLTTPYKQKQLYMWEVATGSDSNKQLLLWTESQLKQGGPFDVNSGAVDFSGDWDANKQQLNAWYYRLYNTNDWIFNGPQGVEDKDIYNNDNFILKLGNENIYQTSILKYAKNFSYTPFICSFGKSENYVKMAKEGVAYPEISSENYLVISVNGDETKTAEQLEKELSPEQNKSSIIYNVKKSVNLTPANADITNYLIIKGEVLLLPKVNLSNDIILADSPRAYYTHTNYKNLGMLNASNFAVDTKAGKEHYVCVVYDYEFPSTDINNVQRRYITDEAGYSPMFIAPTDNMPEKFEYKYNSGGTTLDQIKKVPVIECELKVGNKYLVETGLNELNWYDENNLPMIDLDGTMVEHRTFSVGFNPKIGDFILGKKHEIENTVTHDMNLGDEKGLAIPIHFDDNIAGQIEFKILGPVNSIYNDVIRRHATWFRAARYKDNDKALLSYIENIYIKDFSIIVATDNLNKDNILDKDLIYVSDEQHNLINKKDDISFKLNTMLTPDEAYDLGLNTSINLSTMLVYDKNKTYNLINIMKNDVADKPEKMYVDYYYNLYKKPNLIMETDLFEYFSNTANLNLNPFITYNYHNNKFKLIGKSLDVKNCVANCKFRLI